MDTSEAAALLRDTATKRREYKLGSGDRFVNEMNDRIEMECRTLESAAEIVEGSLEPLYSYLPSWHWTPEMEKALDVGVQK